MEEHVALLDERPVCPGASRPVLRTVLHWAFYITYLVVVLPIPLLICFFVAILIVLATPFIFILPFLQFLGNLVALCLGRFIPPFEHSPLLSKPDNIRLLEILPGAGSDTVRCRMIEDQCSTAKYEAPSYTWGCELGWGRPCVINERMMVVTPTLARALHCLRDAANPRLVWIDAICINQRDSLEESAQVQQMKDVYRFARGVIVWLDVDSWAKPPSGSVGLAFDAIADIIERNSIDVHKAWEDNAQSIQTMSTIFQLPWWDRIWIIQEVALSRNITVQCRECTLSWDDLCRLIALPSTPQYLRLPDGLQEFIRRVEKIRRIDSSDPHYGLLAFVHSFRYSLASESKDRLYALRGLIKSPENLPDIAVDYAQSEADLWTAFTKDCLLRHGSLNAFSLTDSEDRTWLDTNTPTWVAHRFGNQTLSNGRLDATAVRQPLWLGTTRSKCWYSAAGYTAARFRVDLIHPDVISVQGYIYDRIASVSDVFRLTDTMSKQQSVLRQWLQIALKHVKSSNSVENMLADTITGGIHDENDRDILEDYLRHDILDNPDSHQWTKIASIIHAASNLRRLIVTERSQTIGLSHAQSKSGDYICVLLGSDVPYILRRSRHDVLGPSHPLACWLKGCSRRKHMDCCVPEFHWLIGQAYVREIMHYQGDIEEDIRHGSVQLKEFFLE